MFAYKYTKTRKMLIECFRMTQKKTNTGEIAMNGIQFNVY